ncbi:MAG TPA: prepilin-type N-terminal cleavage/methylation domain-containing protein [Verrucomicrobiae bacterium]|nr:prepilin-type N-terminal cleavage/methylation domain-containing protein [Verrucomicrobiae bacterium]
MMKNRVAFTLPQLLVGVAVGSLLIVALLPTLQSDHDTLQRALCANNLREIGQAITMYASDNNDFFPPGYVSGGGATDWHLLVGPYVGMSHITYTSGPAKSSVFICPAAVLIPPPGTTVNLTYTAHRAMFWCSPSPCTPLPVTYKMSQCIRPSEVVMVFDGCQQSVDFAGAFDAQACSDQLADTTIAYPGINPNNAEPAGANTDGPSGVGLIRWRHSNNTGANFLMVDGHVNSLLIGQLLRRNLRYDK